MCKGGHVAAPGCEWDTRGGFTKTGPGDSQNRVPRSFFLSVSYGPEPRVGVAAPGDRRWTGATPPFCCPQRARGCCAIHICATPPGGVAPVQIILAGRPGGRPRNGWRPSGGGRWTGSADAILITAQTAAIGASRETVPAAVKPARLRLGHPHELRAYRCRIRDFRVGPGEQHCERCGEIIETLWRWMESRPCARCGRDTRIVDPFCDRCQRDLRAARYRNGLRIGTDESASGEGQALSWENREPRPEIGTTTANTR